MSVIETTVIVSRRDADTMPVIHVRDEWTFESEAEQRVFTDELILWMDDRPVPGGLEVKTFARKGYKGELALMRMIDRICPSENAPINYFAIKDDLDVPDFLKENHG